MEQETGTVSRCNVQFIHRHRLRSISFGICTKLLKILLDFTGAYLVHNCQVPESAWTEYIDCKERYEASISRIDTSGFVNNKGIRKIEALKLDSVSTAAAKFVGGSNESQKLWGS